MNRSPNLLGFLLPVGLALAAITLSWWGWASHPDPAGPLSQSDLLYKAIRTLGPGGDFDRAGYQANRALEAARWLGLIVAFWAVLSLVYLGLRDTRIYLMAQMRRRHIVVIGATPFADHFSQTAASQKVEVIQLRDGAVAVDGEHICLPYQPNSRSTLRHASVRTARRLIVAVDDDAVAADIAMSAQAQYQHIALSLRMNDLYLANRIHSLPGAEKLRAFTEASAAAREIVRRHPPFLMAQDLGHGRIHLVLMGDADWVEALMVETIVSACTLTFGAPAFTFIATDPEALKSRLFERYPDLGNAATVTFYDGHGGLHVPLTIRDVAQLQKLGPVTGAYCALDDYASSLSTALALRDQLAHDDSFKAAIFVRVDGAGMKRPVSGSRLEPGALVPFAGLDDIARATGILSVHGEDAEKAWHKAYLKFAPAEKAAAVPWEDLPEEFRVSNQRAVAHMYAKLFEAGFDLRPWLASHDSWMEIPALAKGETLWRNSDDRTRLAELEHERWIADRRMNGWRGGALRDNARKTHNNIVPFDQLTPQLQAYDYRFVDLLATVLKRGRGALSR